MTMTLRSWTALLTLCLLLPAGLADPDARAPPTPGTDHAVNELAVGVDTMGNATPQAAPEIALRSARIVALWPGNATFIVDVRNPDAAAQDIRVEASFSVRAGTDGVATHGVLSTASVEAAPNVSPGETRALRGVAHGMTPGDHEILIYAVGATHGSPKVRLELCVEQAPIHVCEE